MDVLQSLNSALGFVHALPPLLCNNIITLVEAPMNFILLSLALSLRSSALEPVQNLYKEKHGSRFHKKLLSYEKDTESWQGLCHAWLFDPEAGAQLHG